MHISIRDQVLTANHTAMKSLLNTTNEKPHPSEIQANADELKIKICDASERSLSTRYNNLGDRVRKYFLNALFILLTCHGVYGEIKNGYGDIREAKESLRVLRAMLVEAGNLNLAKRRKIEENIGSVEHYISFYELTDDLLSQFKVIAPELYAQVDTITDRLGRQVDVHIQFVTAFSTEIQAEGSTYINPIHNDKDACQSEHGTSTVSVKVWVVPRALEVLAHELGHIKYLVPNFASYLNFFKSHYHDRTEINSAGHDWDDPSGQSAIQFAKRFQKNYSKFLKSSIRRPHDPSTLLARLRKETKTL